MKSKITDFIKRRFPVDNRWCDGNCYWMAYILAERFPELEIVYEPIIGHFIVTDGNRYYDWTGEVQCEVKPLFLKNIQNTDPLWYKHLMRDCRD
jgi:hypothetical protein